MEGKYWHKSEIIGFNFSHLCIKNTYFSIHVFLLSDMFVSWDSSHFRLCLTLGNLYFKNTDEKKSKCRSKNVIIYEINCTSYKKLTIYSMTTLKVNVAPQSQVKTGVSDPIQQISAFKYLGTLQ